MFYIYDILSDTFKLSNSQIFFEKTLEENE